MVALADDCSGWLMSRGEVLEIDRRQARKYLLLGRGPGLGWPGADRKKMKRGKMKSPSKADGRALRCSRVQASTITIVVKEAVNFLF